MQEINYIKSEAYDRSFTYKKIAIEYLSKKSFAKRYPNQAGGYRIIGAIGKSGKEEMGNFSIEGSCLPYYQLKYSKLLYEIDGYIEVDKDVYIAVVKSKIVKILMFTFVLLVLLSCMTLYFVNRSEIPIDSLANKYTPPLTLPENADPSHISIPGYSDIKMEAGTDVAYVSLWNPDENPCYFVFTIVDASTNEKLYQSKMVPPGYAVSEVNLNKAISEGSHPVTIRINTYDLQDYKVQLNGGEVQANLLGIKVTKK